MKQPPTKVLQHRLPKLYKPANCHGKPFQKPVLKINRTITRKVHGLEELLHLVEWVGVFREVFLVNKFWGGKMVGKTPWDGGPLRNQALLTHLLLVVEFQPYLKNTIVKMGSSSQNFPKFRGDKRNISIETTSQIFRNRCPFRFWHFQ